jgi:hypothetical protein
VRACLLAPAEAPGDLGQPQLRQAVLDAHHGVFERDVAHEVAGDPFREPEPDLQRAPPALDLDGQRKPVTPRGRVGELEAGEQATAGLLPRLAAASPLAADVDRCRKLGRRCAAQPEAVLAEAMNQPQLHAIEQELRRTAQVVVPGDQRIANQDLALFENPVAKPRVGGLRGRIDLDAGDVQDPGPVAADAKPRAIDRQAVEPQRKQGQRRPRDHHVDAGQFEQRRGRRTRAVADPHPGQPEPGVPAIPAGGEPVDLDRLAELARHERGELRPVRLGPREHHEPHRQQGEREADEDRDQGDAGDPGQTKQCDLGLLTDRARRGATRA